MEKPLNILIVDDHPIIVEGYRNALLTMEPLEGYSIHVDTAKDCDEANAKLKKSSRGNHPYDMIFLDIKLPASADGRITSGEDLGTIAKRLIPKAKIIILTMFNENSRIYSMLKTMNPDGLLVKSDLTSDEFLRAFKVVLSDTPYYSRTVSNFLRSQTKNDIILDDIDRAILYHLSRGVKTKNLPEYISLSLAGIEKRKRQLKNAFGVERYEDEKLLDKAREKGFI